MIALFKCTRCGSTFDPAAADLPLDDPLAGICESCWQHARYLRSRADTALDRLSVRWAHAIPTTGIEETVAILELLTGLNNKKALALSRRIIRWGVKK